MGRPTHLSDPGISVMEALTNRGLKPTFQAMLDESSHGPEMDAVAPVGATGFSFASDEPPMSAMDLDIQADEALLIQQTHIGPPGLELSGRSVLDIVVPADRTLLREATDDVMSHGGIVRLRLRLDMGDSPYALLGVAKLSGPLPIGVSGLFCDSQLSMYGAEVDESALYRELFERLPISVYFKDAESKLLRANTNLVRDLGYSNARDVVGKTDEMLLDPADQRAGAHVDDEVRGSGMPMVGVTEVHSSPDGTSKVVHASRYPVRNRQGRIVGTMGFSHDVTQSARVVDALARSEQRYALAAKASRDGIWDYSLEKRTFELSPRMSQLLGLPVTTEPIDEAHVFALFNPEDAKRLRRAYGSLKYRAAESFEELVCVERRDGECVWLEVVGTALSEDGMVVRLIGSAADVTDDREREARLEHLARHDPLTGLVNRRVLVQRVNEAIDGNGSASLLCLDLDYFKVINDSLGHQAGDEVLCHIADRLRSVTGPGNVLGRLGGDEFAVLINGASKERVEEIAAEMTAAVRKELNVSGLDLFTTASIGVVHLADGYNDANQAFRDADIALYVAKSNGKARHEVFEDKLRVAADDELDRQVVVRRAVQNNAFFLMYQPIFDTTTRQITGVEALLRLTKEDGTIESPMGFLPYLEQTELISEIGEWVIEEALSTLATWRNDKLVGEEFRMALNVSRKQFQGDRFGHFVVEAIERYGLVGSDVVLEITETAVADQNTSIGQTLSELRSKGIKIALDDFGTGQSSLAVLHDLPVDILKIDKSFTNRISANKEEPVTRAALWLAKSMGLVTVAEGVESESQFDWLVGNGCDMVQGFLLGHPLVAADVPELFGRLRTVIEPAVEDHQSWDFGDEEAREAAWASLNAISEGRMTLAEWARLSGDEEREPKPRANRPHRWVEQVRTDHLE